MKKIVLLTAVFLLSMISVSANERRSTINTVAKKESSRYGYMQPIRFSERGVAFFVFPNGEFDFNTHPRYRNSRRRVSINTTYGAPGGPRSHYYSDYSVRIEHDHLGRVRRIGNVFLNYDAYGRIKRVGSIYMRYRHGRLYGVGGLRIYYNRFGDIIRTTGVIKHNMGCHFCGVQSCGINHYEHSNHHNNGWNNNHHNDYYNDDHEEDYYYYRNNKNGKDKTSKKRK